MTHPRHFIKSYVHTKFNQCFSTISSSPPWTYTCDDSLRKCVKTFLHPLEPYNRSEVVGLGQCLMFCSPGSTLFPAPTGVVNLGNTSLNFLPGDVKMLVDRRTPNSVRDPVRELRPVLRELFFAAHPDYDFAQRNPFVGTKSGARITIKLCVKESTAYNHATSDLDEDESYEIEITPMEDDFAVGSPRGRRKGVRNTTSRLLTKSVRERHVPTNAHAIITLRRIPLADPRH